MILLQTVNLKELADLLAQSQNQGLPDWLLVLIPIVFGGIVNYVFGRLVLKQQQESNFTLSSRLNEQVSRAGINRLVIDERFKAHKELLALVVPLRNMNIDVEDLTKSTYSWCQSDKDFRELQIEFVNRTSLNKSFISSKVFTKVETFQFIMLCIMALRKHEYQSVKEVTLKYHSEISNAISEIESELSDFFENQMSSDFLYTKHNQDYFKDLKKYKIVLDSIKYFNEGKIVPDCE